MRKLYRILLNKNIAGLSLLLPSLSFASDAIGGYATAPFAMQAVYASDKLQSNANYCSIEAFVIETDPAGLNVRQAPSHNSKILGVIPPVLKNEDGNNVSVVVSVIMSNAAGWFKIQNAIEDTMLTNKPARPVFAGIGWVHGSKLAVVSQAEYGYTSSDYKSERNIKLTDDNLGIYVDTFGSRLIDCKGNWAQLNISTKKLSPKAAKILVISPSAKKSAKKGYIHTWVNNICGNQETSCDGAGDPDPNIK